MTDPEHRYLLPRFSVSRPVTVVMILVALLVVGAIAYTRLPLGLFPGGFEEPWLGVWIGNPNASPFEVEQKIARPLEGSVATIPRVNRIYTSSSRGGCWSSLQFRSGTNMREAYAQLRDRMDRLMPEMPDEVERIQIRKWDPEDIPTMWMGVYLEGDYADPYHVLDTQMRPILQRVEGVAAVEIWGAASKHVAVELDQEKIRSHGVNVYRVGSDLTRHNFTLPAGYVLEGGKKIYVRSIGRFETIDQIGNLQVDPAHNLRLTDIATVGLKRPKREWVNRINRMDALGVEIKKTSSGNVVDISHRVRAALEELKARPQLQGLDFEIFWDQGEHVTESIDNLKTTGTWGGMFAAMILFFFLRAVRMTAIITLAIPLAVMITLTVIYFLGWSLNLLTMMGLMLSLGLVVDNAIVIVENIYRKRQEGVEPRAAAIDGAGEVGLAVTMATLTTVVVFLPLILMSGGQEFAFFMLRLGMPVIVGLLASLFIALIFIPLTTLRLSSSRERPELKLIGRLRRVYVRWLDRVLSHRVDTVIIVLLMMASIQIPMEAMKKTDRQNRQNNVWLRFDMPAGQSLEQADRFMTSVEDTLYAHDDEYNIRAIETRFGNAWGRVNIMRNQSENDAWYQVAFENLLQAVGLRESPHLEYNEMVEDIKERLVLPAGVRLHMRGGSGSEDASIAISLYGEDTRVLIELSEEVERRLQSIPGLLGVQTDMDRGTTELQVRLNREQVRRYGVQPQEISGNISYALRGRDLSKFRTEDGREINIHFQLEEVDRQSMHQLRNLTFRTEGGKEVPLESLATLYVSRTLGGIRRENRQTMLTVTATATKEDSKELFEQIDLAMAGFEMPRGYRWDKGARYERIEESDESQKFALMLSVTFVFLLMGVLFESFVLPLSVIIAIPFSFLGVYWTLYLSGTAFDVLCGIGTVILVGVVVNNAIVLIDLANRLRAEGMNRHDALVEAGKHRFRPILMTTFTTIFGLLPMAVGNSKMIGLPYAPLGRTMMGGLLASTFLTLVIVPLFYTLFDDLRILLQRITATAVQRSRGVIEEVAGD
ncbi:efflux RND transporter permease subunit [Candidatus Latescibacterota bacterium]